MMVTRLLQVRITQRQHQRVAVVVYVKERRKVGLVLGCTVTEAGITRSRRVGILVSERQGRLKEHRITLTMVMPDAVVAQRFALKLYGSIQLGRELWPAGAVAMRIIERQTRIGRRDVAAALIAVCRVKNAQQSVTCRRQNAQRIGRFCIIGEAVKTVKGVV